MEHLRKKDPSHLTAPKRYDEVIYTPFAFGNIPISDFEPLNTEPQEILEQVGAIQNVAQFLEQNIDSRGKSIPANIIYEDLAKRIAPIGEILVFDYGVIVMWGFTAEEEQLILEDLMKYEQEKLDNAEVEIEQFYFHYNTYYQPRIFNDIITLKVQHAHLGSS